MNRVRQQPRLAAAVGLVVIVVASSIVRIALNSNATGAWIFADELIYSELARTAFSGFSIRGVPVSGYGSIYPLIIAPAYLIGDLVTAYRVAQATNAIVMSLTAIPVYLTARLLVDRRWALIAAALSVAIPAMTYSSVIMTESAFYPIFALSVYVAVTAIATGSYWRQALMVPLTILAFETRQQGVAIFPAYALALAVFAILELVCAATGSRKRVLASLGRRFWMSVLLILGGVVGVIGVQAVRGKSLSSLLGAYQILAQGAVGNEFRPRVTAAVFVQHIAEMALWLGFIPIIALVVLVAFAVRSTSTREMRAFVATAVSFVLVMTAVVAAFAVFTNIGRIEERNLFYVGYLALIALVWWAAASLPRQPRVLAVACVAVVAVAAALPVATLVGVTAISDTFGLYLPWALQTAWKDATMTPMFIVLIGVAAAAVALIVPQQRAWLVVAAVAGYLILTGAVVDHRTDAAAQGALSQGISGAPNWVDRAVGEDANVAVVYPGTLEPLKVWENEFFNRSLGTIYALGAPMPAALPETDVDIDGQGIVRDRAGNPISARLVLTDTSVHLDGTVIARDARRHMEVLSTPHGPLRSTQRTAGIYDDGWSGGEFDFTRYRCSGGTSVAVVASDPVLHPAPLTVTPIVNGQTLAPTTIPPQGDVSIRVPLTPADGACSVRFLVDPTAVPAVVFGAPDTRALGVQVRRIDYEP